MKVLLIVMTPFNLMYTNDFKFFGFDNSHLSLTIDKKD